MDTFITYSKIPALSPKIVHDYLWDIGRQWTGQGIAIELGSWLGATSVPLLEGLVKAGYDRPFLAYDSWQANNEQVFCAQEQGVKIENKQDLQPIFYENVAKVYDKVYCFKGRIEINIRRYPPQLPIEICILDAPKKDSVFDPCIKILQKYWIPGVTTLGLLDYYFYKDHTNRPDLLAPVKYIESHRDNFEKIVEWPDRCSCVFFKYIKKI